MAEDRDAIVVERAGRCWVVGANLQTECVAMAKVLGQFSITRETDGYILYMEDDDGDTVEYTASFEQLDLISEAIEEQLEMDEDDVLGVVDEEDETPGDDE